MPIDDEMTCHRKRKAIETTRISTGTMTVSRGRFIIRICARNRPDATPEPRQSAHKMIDFVETDGACNNQIKCDNIV
jgi:hypothetical protein